MQQEALTVGGGAGGPASQANTQSPQGASASTFTGTKGSAVQPGTAAASLNNSQGGVTLEPQSLTNVNLSTSQNQNNANSKIQTDKAVEFNPFLLLLTVVFVLVAAAMVWGIQRSVKSTTDNY